MNLNGSANSKSCAAFPAWILPPAMVSFFTGAPFEKSSSANGTQKALGLVAESKKKTLLRWSWTVRHSVDERLGFDGWVMPSGTPIDRIRFRQASLGLERQLRFSPQRFCLSGGR